jgi:hypothetical protein
VVSGIGRREIFRRCLGRIVRWPGYFSYRRLPFAINQGREMLPLTAFIYTSLHPLLFISLTSFISNLRCSLPLSLYLSLLNSLHLRHLLSSYFSIHCSCFIRIPATLLLRSPDYLTSVFSRLFDPQCEFY